MVVSAADKCVRAEPEDAHCVVYVPQSQRRQRNGVKNAHMVQYRAPVTINIGQPQSQPAEQPQERPAKKQSSQALVETAVLVVVGLLVLTAVVVLCLHYLGPMQADQGSAAPVMDHGPETGLPSDRPPEDHDYDRAFTGAEPSPEANSTVPAVDRVTSPSSSVTEEQDTEGCREPAHMFQCGPSGADSHGTECRLFYSRADWGAKPPNKRVLMVHPIKYVVVSHTTLSRCGDLASCGKQIRSMQAYHLSLKYDDLGYNFLVSDDGSVYEGRGWYRASPHLGKRGDTALGVSFLGDYCLYDLTEQQVKSMALLLDYGLRCGYLDDDYQLVAHNQTRDTQSPGHFVFQRIQHWSHYSNTTVFQ